MDCGGGLAQQARTPSNSWPEYPRILKTDYGQQEAEAVFGKDPRVYQTTVKEFLKDENGNLRAAVLVKLKPERDGHRTIVPGIYTAGDMRRGQSLVVWAIREGRNAAREVDEDLMGYSNLGAAE